MDSSFRIFVFITASETQLEGDDASQYNPHQNCMLSIIISVRSLEQLNLRVSFMSYTTLRNINKSVERASPAKKNRSLYCKIEREID